MANLTIKDTGLDHLYPDGVPIIELGISISEIFALAARLSSLTVNADPYFLKLPQGAKVFSELHGEGDRIAGDFLQKGARDIAPVFSAFQRWMTPGNTPDIFEYNSTSNPGKIILRWLNLDNRKYKLNYTADNYSEICMDPNNFANIQKYMKDALVDFLLQELYRAIGYDKKYVDFHRSYEQNRQQVAFWVKNDNSTKTGYHYAGV
jgi:hypothetical protein